MGYVQGAFPSSIVQTQIPGPARQVYVQDYENHHISSLTRREVPISQYTSTHRHVSTSSVIKSSLLISSSILAPFLFFDLWLSSCVFEADFRTYDQLSEHHSSPHTSAASSEHSSHQSPVASARYSSNHFRLKSKTISYSMSYATQIANNRTTTAAESHTRPSEAKSSHVESRTTSAKHHTSSTETRTGEFLSVKPYTSSTSAVESHSSSAKKCSSWSIKHYSSNIHTSSVKLDTSSTPTSSVKVNTSNTKKITA